MKNNAEKFIKYVLSIYNPNYDRNILYKGLSLGLTREAVQACLRIINTNPELFKVQTLKVYKKNGSLLTIIIKKLK